MLQNTIIFLASAVIRISPLIDSPADLELLFFVHPAQVGSYVMSTLRHWIEQHRVKEFPMCHSALLVLEAEALASTNPDAAWSLLIAAADGAQTPDDIR